MKHYTSKLRTFDDVTKNKRKQKKKKRFFILFVFWSQLVRFLVGFGQVVGLSRGGIVISVCIGSTVSVFVVVLSIWACVIQILTVDSAVITRTAELDSAFRIEYDHNGAIVKQSAAAREVGTTVELRNLFHSLPVRLQEVDHADPFVVRCRSHNHSVPSISQTRVS